MSWLEDLQELLDIKTGSGSWNALAFIVLIVVLYSLVNLLRSRGRTDFAPAKYKGTPFFSGNPVPVKFHIGGSNSYWGFKTALKPYYDRVLKMHSGNVNDYVFWFTAGLALAFLMVVLL